MASLHAHTQEAAVAALHDPVVVRQHRRSLRVVPRHPSAVIVPCAATKPYRISRSHARGYLPALRGKPVDIWVLSDLMGLIPYPWSDAAPNLDYEMAPSVTRGRARNVLVNRLSSWLSAYGDAYSQIYLALPLHHMRLLLAARMTDDLPLLDVSISACREVGGCPPTHFRATSSAYIDYLREAVVP